MYKIRIITSIVAVILITIGGLIYIIYRPLSLYMFRWTGLSEKTEWLQNLRNFMPCDIPDWIIYALPDGLWVCSYVLMIATLWDFKLKECWLIASVIPFIGIFSELMQAIKLIPGKFDIMDLITYLGGTLCAFIYVIIINNYMVNKLT